MKSMLIISTVGFELLVVTSKLVGVYAFFFQAELTGSPEFQARFNTIPILAGMHVMGAGAALEITPAACPSRSRFHGAILCVQSTAIPL